MIELKIEGQLCACNCGGYAKPGSRFINHHGRRIHPHVIKNSHPCECGCGEYAKPGNRFVNGHQRKCKPSWNAGLTKETDQRVAQSANKISGKPSWNAGLTKENNESVNKISVALKGKPSEKKGKPGHPSWCKGLTKEIDERVAAYGKKGGESRKGKKQKTGPNRKKRRPSSPESIAKWKVTMTASGLFCRSEETKQKSRISNLITWAKPEIRAKISGKNSPCWIGGDREYAVDFASFLKNKMRRRDGNVCRLCNKSQEENKGQLPVHHINYDKKYSNEDNLITLCRSCHAKTTAIKNRDYYRKFLTEILKSSLLIEKNKLGIRISC